MYIYIYYMAKYTCTYSETLTHQSQLTNQTKLSCIYKTGLFDLVYRAYSQPTFMVSPYLGGSILQLGSSIWSSHC